MRRVIRVVQDQREARYNLLRGYFHGADDDTVHELEQERLSTLTLPFGAKAIGKPLGHFALHAMGARVVTLRRASGKSLEPDDDTVLADGDTLVLGGRAAQLAVAEEKLLRG